MAANRDLNSDYLRAFLNLYWLRPETALWRTLDCLALRKLEIEFARPILDVGCGDGLFSFTRAGGRILPEFDMFTHTANLESFTKNEDIYDFVDSELPAPEVDWKPFYQIDLGIDHKKNLLQKARNLNFYQELRECDANQALPIQNDSFNTIYCNVLYWLENYGLALREFQRILRPGGKAIVQVPSDTFRDYSFYQRCYVRTSDPQWRWLEQIDRGRSENIQQCKGYEEWVDVFSKAGLTVTSHCRYLSKTILEVWDIGLRPISNLLIEMANKLQPSDRSEIKQKWVEQLTPIVEPLCELEWATDAEHPPGFFVFVLHPTAAVV